MRVVHIGHVPLPKGVDMGAKASRDAYHPGRWVLNLAQAQAAHTDIRPEIVIKVPGTTRQVTTELKGIKAHFVGVPNILRGKTGFFLDQRILARAVMKLKPDLVHAHGTEEANALAALRCPVPRVLTVQGCFFIINKKIRPKFLSRQWIVERLERRTIPQFRYVIAKSNYIAEALGKEFPGIQLDIIPNTYDEQLEHVPFQLSRTSSAAYVGSIVPWKGFHLLVELFESWQPMRTSEFTFHVFGDKPHVDDGYEGEMKNRLQSALGERLQLHGLLPQIEVTRIVSTCKMLLAPSLEDMFGNQAIEAMLVGTPVLTIEGTAIAENVKRFGNGLVADRESLTESFCRLLAEPQNDKKSALAREAIIKEMNPKNIAEKHLAVYRRCLAQNI